METRRSRASDSIHRKLSRLFDATPAQPIGDSDRIVILSDLHLGDGGSGDDYAGNAPLVETALDRHYRRGGYRVVLNGDIEELMRHPLARILDRWGGFYRVLGRFPDGHVVKLVGNHDLALRDHRFSGTMPPVREAARFRFDGNDIFIFHGHQASHLTERAHRVSNWMLRGLARPLGIPNYSVAHDSRRKFRVEERVYHFARRQRVMAIIGHTHRPLFESLSKIDSLKFRIERLCREFPEMAPPARAQAAAEIRRCQADLSAHGAAGGGGGALYHEGPLVPCLFNSGCAIGKRGITAIEIAGGAIALVHWFDRRCGRGYAGESEDPPKLLAGTDFCRVVIKREPLAYLFTRIHLLGGEPAGLQRAPATPRERMLPGPALGNG